MLLKCLTEAAVVSCTISISLAEKATSSPVWSVVLLYTALLNYHWLTETLHRKSQLYHSNFQNMNLEANNPASVFFNQWECMDVYV